MRICARLAALGFLLLSTAGCADYARRSDFVSDDAGEALAANRVMQVVTPWPREGFTTALRSDPIRTEAALRRYHAVDDKPPTSTRPASIVITPQN